MVPMRHVGGLGLVVAGMGMESVFPVPIPGKMEDGFQINAFPVVFGHILKALL